MPFTSEILQKISRLALCRSLIGDYLDIIEKNLEIRE